MTSEPPSQPPARIPTWRRYAKRAAVALGVAVTCLALLCCAGAAYVGFDAYQAPRQEREMAAFADDLCQDLLDGKAAAVYAALSVDSRDRYSAQEFADQLAARGIVTRCEVVRATYLFLLVAYVLIEDAHGEHTIDLVSEAGEWKVESDILHDLDSRPRHRGGGGFDD